MKLKITKKWLDNRREADERYDCSAGDFMLRQPAENTAETKQRRFGAAFGVLVHLWRIDKRFSPEQLAEIADIDSDEIRSIECEDEYRPEPRTVCALASVMDIPASKMLQISGNIIQDDPTLQEASIRFAANAKHSELSREQRQALHQFIKRLSRG
jgi:hypothetical protein